jgi:anti-anti-sigma factor
MNVISYQTEGGRKAIIEVHGRFDFRLHREFRLAYEHAEGARQYWVDLRQATHIDSSALGILLLLRDHAGDSKDDVCIAAHGEVLKVIQMANFQDLFDVVDADGRRIVPQP